MAKRKTEVELSFEEALETLENIVKQLEKGELSLDESITQFSKGVNLSQLCLQKINQAEAEIDKIILEKEGKIIEKPLVVEEDGTC